MNKFYIREDHDVSHRYHIDPNCPAPVTKLTTTEKIALGLVLFACGAGIALLYLWGSSMPAAAAVTTSTHTSYALRSGTAQLATFATEAECRAEAAKRPADEGVTRTTGSRVYTCVISYNVIATFKPNPPEPSRTSLTWAPPTRNIDGTPLTDLAGFKIFYGQDRNNLTQVFDINSPTSTRLDLRGLAPGTWYFMGRAFNRAGVGSDNSNVVSKVIR